MFGQVVSAKTLLFYLVTYSSGVCCGLVDTFLNVYLAQQVRSGSAPTSPTECPTCQSASTATLAVQ